MVDIVTPPVAYKYKTQADINPDKSIRALIFGAPKVGKTALLCTFPGLAVADYDGEGVKVVDSPYFKPYLSKLDLRYESFTNPTDEYGVPTNLDSKTDNAFWNGIKWLNAALKDDSRKTIAIDSLSSMSVAAAYAALPVTAARRNGQTLKNVKVDHLAVFTQGDFGGEMQAIQQLLDQLMQVRNRNIIVLAHEREEKSDSGTVIGRSPLLTGDRLRARVAAWFDEVWYLEARPNGKRVLRCQPYGVLKGVGSRLGLPAEIEDPTYDKIIQLIGR